jgi:hypothetical protein
MKIRHSGKPLLYEVIFRCGEPNHGKARAYLKGDAMAKTMTPPLNEMSEGQINKAVDKFRDAMRKHRRQISSADAQGALGVDNLGTRMFAVFRNVAQAMSGCVVRIVTVSRARSTLDALKACGRTLYVKEEVAATAPRGTAKKQKLVYFKPRPKCYDGNGRLSPQELDDEYTFHGLVVDLQAQIEDNAANPEFADTMPNACQWKDAGGNWCYALFDCWLDERGVCVGHHDDGWDDGLVFAGVPQGSVPSSA